MLRIFEVNKQLATSKPSIKTDGNKKNRIAFTSPGLPTPFVINQDSPHDFGTRVETGFFQTN